MVMARKSDAVSVRIPVDEISIADAIAEKLGTCRAQAIRRAIRDYHTRVNPAEAISRVRTPKA
jgi:predicted DNA-binding protein